MGVVNHSELAKTCQSAVVASKKWCAHIAQAGLSCIGDGSSQAQTGAAAGANQQQFAGTAAPNGAANNPLLLHSIIQGLGNMR